MKNKNMSPETMCKILDVVEECLDNENRHEKLQKWDKEFYEYISFSGYNSFDRYNQEIRDRITYLFSD